MTHKKKLLLAILFGLFLGLGGYTFRYAEGLSYFSTNPKACTNCHIMSSQFDSWQKAAHHTAATCVDCHLPHSFIRKYIAKADNGYRHSKGFTFQDFHEPIFITPRSSRILQENCVRCHAGMVHDIRANSSDARDALRCVHCHQGVGHGETTGLGGANLEQFKLKEEL